MKIYYGCAIFIFFCLAISCNNPGVNQPEERKMIIDLTDFSEPEPFLPLSDAIEKLEIISLETNPLSLIKEIEKIIVTDKDIYLYDLSNLYRFNKEGKFLNQISKKGDGPGEYVWITDIQIDEKENKVYLMSLTNIQVFNPDGTFIEKIDLPSVEEIFSGDRRGMIIQNGNYFLRDGLPVNPDKTSVWNYALTDKNFNIQKTFYNPSHKEYAKELAENHRLDMGWKNYWTESIGHLYDFYDNEFKIIYYGVDSIYQFNNNLQEFESLYTLHLGERPSFELSHQWIKKMEFWKYGMPLDFFDTKDNLYFVIGKNASKYLVKFDKQTGATSYTEVKGEIKEIQFPNGFLYTRRDTERVGFTDDMSGSGIIFEPQKQTNGKYWACGYEASEILEQIDINQLKMAEAKQSQLREQLIKILSGLDEEDNPVIFIGNLK